MCNGNNVCFLLHDNRLASKFLKLISRFWNLKFELQTHFHAELSHSVSQRVQFKCS
jgi:hypothetical protein